MSIFDSIKNAIFGHPAAAAPTGSGASSAAPGSGASSAAPSGASSAPAAKAAPPAPPTSAPPAAGKPAGVDIETVLESMAKNNSQKLNWQSSIVDLMKLVGLDPSLQNRKQLATELGYKGDPNDSAQMNLWLHKQVMQKLVENGGIAPASLRG